VIDVPAQSDFTKLLREVVTCVKRGPVSGASGEKGGLLFVSRPGPPGWGGGPKGGARQATNSTPQQIEMATPN